MPRPTTKFLVVCGTKSVADDWLFGNFLGFCRALILLGVEGDFWSCFPSREYFQSPYDNVKFGTRGSSQAPEDQQAIEIFSKAEFYNGEKFWKQIAFITCDSFKIAAPDTRLKEFNQPNISHRMALTFE